MTSQAFPSAPAPRARRAEWESATIAFGGGETLAVFETGSRRRRAPTLLLVHGLGHWTQAAWDSIAAEFESTHRIVAFDLPGFGDSSNCGGPYTLSYFTTAVACVVQTLGLRDFALAGHSLGGLISANYAAEYGGGLRHLALVAPAGFLRTPALALRVAGSGPVTKLLANVPPPRALVRWTFEGSVFDRSTVLPDYIEHAYVLTRDPAYTRAYGGVYSGAVPELLHHRALLEHLGRWRGMTSIVWGRQDRYVPIRGLRNARRVYPHAAVLEIDRCGHCPNVEYPELVAQHLMRSGA